MMQGLLSVLKGFWQWFKKPENAILLFIILAFFLLILFDRYHFYNFGFTFKDNSQDRVSLFSTLLQSVATVFALIVSLLFVAVQLSAQAYTPRVIKKHFASLHFVSVSIAMLGTIIYLILIRGGHSYFADRGSIWHTDMAILASLFCFASLVPLVIRTYKLMSPKFLLEELVFDISVKDFEDVYRKRKERELGEKLQPLFDIIRGSISKGDLQTAREAFEKMNDRFGKMIRETKEEPLSEQMAKTLSQRMLEIGLFANHEGKIELTMETFLLFQKFLDDFSKARRRASAIILHSQLKDLKEDFVLRYPRKSYPKQRREVTRIFIRCRGILARIVPERREALEENIDALREMLETKEVKEDPYERASIKGELASDLFEYSEVVEAKEKREALLERQTILEENADYYKTNGFLSAHAGAKNEQGITLRYLAIILEGDDRKKCLEQSIEAYKLALEVRTPKDVPKDYASTQNSLGNTLSDLADMFRGDEKRKYLDEATKAYRLALEVYTRKDFPEDYATTQNNLGVALTDLADVFEGNQRKKYLEGGIEAYRSALEIFTHKDFPSEFAMTQHNLGAAMRVLAAMSEPHERRRHLNAAVKVSMLALEVYTHKNFPMRYAGIQNNLGAAYNDLADISKIEEKKGMLEKSKECYLEALTIYTEEHFPHQHKGIRGNLERLERIEKDLAE